MSSPAPARAPSACVVIAASNGTATTSANRWLRPRHDGRVMLPRGTSSMRDVDHRASWQRPGVNVELSVSARLGDSTPGRLLRSYRLLWTLSINVAKDQSNTELCPA